jgi:hypothetical protein
MSGLFSQPKQPDPVPVVSPADTQNRLNNALAKKLGAGGTNANQLAPTSNNTGGGRQPTLTGLN